MARLLISDEYPSGHELDAIFDAIRQEVLKSSSRMAHDGRPETRRLLGHVIECNKKVLQMLNQAKNTVESIFSMSPAKERVLARCQDGNNPRAAG